LIHSGRQEEQLLSRLVDIIRHNFYLLILLATSLQRLLWFQGDKALIGGDLFPLLNPVTYLGNLSYIWNEANFGSFEVSAPRLFNPSYLSTAVGQVLGLGYSTSEMIFVVSMYSLAAASIYYLWPIIFRQPNWQRSAFAASIAYVYSPYLIADGIQTSVRFALQYAVVPFFLLLFVRGVTREDARYAVLFALLSPLMFSDFPGYQVAGYVVISCLLFSVFHMVSTKRIRFNLQFFSLSSLLSLLVNMWWLLPIFANIDSYSGALTLRPGDFAAQRDSTVTQVLRFLGKWSFYTSNNGVNYIPYSAAYNANPLSVALSFGPIALAFAALLVRPRSRPVLFCAWVAVIGLFLTKGINPPLGNLYQGLLSLFPPFRVYRESFYLLQLTVIPTALLIGATIGRFLGPTKSSKVSKGSSKAKLAVRQLRKGIIPIVLIAIILGASWPLLTNDISVNGLGGESRGVKIPDAYSKLVDWMGRDPDAQYSKVLVLPQRDVYAAYTWGYVGGNFMYYALPNVVLGGWAEYLPAPNTQWAADLLYESFYTNSSAFPRLLNIFGIKYIVLENTFDTSFYGVPTIEFNRALLTHRSVLVLAKDFGDVTVYRNLNFTSEIYLAKTLIPFDYSIDQPGGVVWQDTNVTSDWTVEKWSNESTSFGSSEGVLNIALPASSGYTTGSVIKQVNITDNAGRYLVVHYKTNAFTSFTIEIRDPHGTYYPSAVNSPTGVESKSVEWYTQAFELQASRGDPQAIRVWITNYLDRTYSGKLELWIDSMSVAKFIGSTDDFLRIVKDSSVQDPFSFYTLSQENVPLSNIPNDIMSHNSTILSMTKLNPTSYNVVLQLSGPTLLVLDQAFSKDWTARVGRALVQDHVLINHFANGWLLTGNGRTEVNLQFSAQALVGYGAGISLVSIAIAFVILIRIQRKRMSLDDRVASENNRSSPTADHKEGTN